jgi:hypothetical protein
MNTEKTSLENENQPSCLGAVMCSSCSSVINTTDKKHCFWDEDIEQGTPLICFECYMENETIIRAFGF